ncbi:MAG TPA: hypothetical protein VJ860_16175 [Polyangia bacterium]|jgi:hypothetical protein|nr:hypothetical protein [Polyangia bacterium]
MSRTSAHTSLTLLGLSIVLAAGPARAQGATSAPAAPAAQGPDDGGDPSRRGADLDPNLDRGFLLPTAMTQPARTVTYSNYELVLHGITLGITDRLQASLTVLPPYVKDIPFVGTLSLKGQIVSASRVHVAAQGSITVAGGSSSDSGAVFSLGLLTSICLDDGCESLLSASATWLNANGDNSVLVYGGSLLGRISEHAKLLAEVVSAAGGSDFDAASTFLLNYGVRFHSHNFAGDIGLVRPIGEDVGDEFVLGFPFINFSYRSP